MTFRETNRETQFPPPAPETQAAIEAASLRYVSDRMPGFTRVKRGRGFAYVDVQGKPLTERKHRDRVEALKIPPAWTRVWISPWANGHIQATGRDERRRKQYIYHSEWRRVRDETKFVRMMIFGERLASIRRRVRSDLAKPGLPREKVLATVISLMDKTLIRVGNEEYAKENDSYGLTTFKNRHAKVRGSRVRFQFKGKSGKAHDIEIEDPRVARVIRHCQDLPGQDLFEYLDEGGNVVPISSGDVNRYLKDVTGEEFTAKDFRTWGGSVRMLRSLLDSGPCETKTSKKKFMVSAIKQTSSMLGNTVAVCRKYYVHPLIFETHSDGRMFGVSKTRVRVRSSGLKVDEVLFLKLLKACSR